MPMNIKFYIATREDKVGTVYSVAEYDNEILYEVHTGKVESQGITAYQDIVRQLVKQDFKQNEGNYGHMLSFKLRNIDNAVHIGNFLDNDEEIQQIKEQKKYCFFSSPAVFLSDVQKMHKAESSLKSYLIMRDYYIKQGKIH